MPLTFFRSLLGPAKHGLRPPHLTPASQESDHCSRRWCLWSSCHHARPPDLQQLQQREWAPPSHQGIATSGPVAAAGRDKAAEPLPLPAHSSAPQCVSSVQAFKAAPSSGAAGRSAVHVVAQKRVQKKQQVCGGRAAGTARAECSCKPHPALDACVPLADVGPGLADSHHSQPKLCLLGAAAARRRCSCTGAQLLFLNLHVFAVLRPQVILVRDVPGLGGEGALKSVPVGYWRNYLQPQGLAAFADAGILEQIRRQREAEERARLEEKAKAQAMVRIQCIGSLLAC